MRHDYPVHVKLISEYVTGKLKAIKSVLFEALSSKLTNIHKQNCILAQTNVFFYRVKFRLLFQVCGLGPE